MRSTAGPARLVLFAAIIAILGLMPALPLFGGAVPVTAQTLGVMLAGSVLGPWRGAASVTLFLILVAVGLPLLAGGRGGIGVFFGPSAGYMLGWIAGAAVIGLIIHAGATRPTWLRTAAGLVVGGIFVVYLFGIPVQSFIVGTSLTETALQSSVFLVGDTIKVVIAALVTMALWKAYPQAFPSFRTTSPAEPAETVASATTNSPREP
ncbi:biotin transporter BioY [uncultured Agrococcus sp.]|uniref:biotin transporter BioY n=1 Tax=uncultured Agrococcus sp. TaxID=382258 RepID=UPI0025EA4B42|nr:biotin transporter BioY [uncultured Agrococcus sp.]